MAAREDTGAEVIAHIKERNTDFAVQAAINNGGFFGIVRDTRASIMHHGRFGGTGSFAGDKQQWLTLMEKLARDNPSVAGEIRRITAIASGDIDYHQLNHLEHIKSNLAVFDPNPVKAVAIFRQEAGLSGSGPVKPEEMRALEEATRKHYGIVAERERAAEGAKWEAGRSAREAAAAKAAAEAAAARAQYLQNLTITPAQAAAMSQAQRDAEVIKRAGQIIDKPRGEEDVRNTQIVSIKNLVVAGVSNETIRTLLDKKFLVQQSNSVWAPGLQGLGINLDTYATVGSEAGKTRYPDLYAALNATSAGVAVAGPNMTERALGIGSAATAVPAPAKSEPAKLSPAIELFRAHERDAHFSIGKEFKDLAVIKEIQGLLKIHPSGVFDKQTEQAVKSLQQQFGMPQTGRVDSGTLVNLTNYAQWGASILPGAVSVGVPIVSPPGQRVGGRLPDRNGNGFTMIPVPPTAQAPAVVSAPAPAAVPASQAAPAPTAVVPGRSMPIPAEGVRIDTRGGVLLGDTRNPPRPIPPLVRPGAFDGPAYRGDVVQSTPAPAAAPAPVSAAVPQPAPVHAASSERSYAADAFKANPKLVIKKGSGDSIVNGEIQRMLMDVGSLEASYKTRKAFGSYKVGDEVPANDGDFGNGTKSAVEDFQRKHGLRVNGDVDEATFKALSAEAKKMRAATPQPSVTPGGARSAATAESVVAVTPQERSALAEKIGAPPLIQEILFQLEKSHPDYIKALGVLAETSHKGRDGVVAVEVLPGNAAQLAAVGRLLGVADPENHLLDALAKLKEFQTNNRHSDLNVPLGQLVTAVQKREEMRR